MMPVMAPAVAINWFPGVVCKGFSEVGHDYQRCRGIIDNDAGQAGEVPADVVYNIDDVLAQEALWEVDVV